MKELKKAVCYYRYSSAGQTEQSIEGQQRVCKEFARKNGYEIINEYIDRAITGKTDKRPAFLKMVQDANNNNFEYVIVYKLDRFSRKRYDSVVYKYRLEQAGVKVISATEAISDTAEGKVMTALLEAFAEMYSEELSQKVKRGNNESVIKGLYLGGHILYGYKVVNKRYEIEPDEAKTVKFIFQSYADGMSQKEIVSELNEKGIKTRTGETWKKNSLQNFFTNTRYIGEYTSPQGTVNNNYFPAIVDKDIFYRAREKALQNKHNAGAGRAKEKYILTGKAFCGHCGGKLVGVSGTSTTGEIHRYYACSTRWNSKNCTKEYENKRELEEFIIKCTLEHVLNPKLLNGIAEALGKVQTGEATQKELQEIQNKLATLETQLDEKYKEFCNASNAEIKLRINKDCDIISEEKAILLNEAHRLQMVLKTGKTKAQILTFFEEYIKRKKTDLSFSKRLIERFIDKIYVFDDKLVIYYNVFETSGITYKKMLADVSNITFKRKGRTSSNTKANALPRIGHQRVSFFRGRGS